jgi:alkyl hydroperoxide reductase subunit AhpC
VFIIGPDKKLKLSLNYPASVGRNMDEIVRVVDALQLSARASVATPANWPNNHENIGAKVRHDFLLIF